MVKKILFILVYLVTLFAFAQQKDSILYFYDYKSASKTYELDFKKHYKSDSTLIQSLDSLQNIGFYSLTLDSVRSSKIYLNKGKSYKNIWVKNDSLFNKNQEWFPVRNLDSLIQTVNQKYAEKGYPFVEVKISPMGFQDNEVRIKLDLNLLQQRKIDKVKVIGYEKLSKGYIKHNLGLKNNQIYNEKELEKLGERIQYNSFIEEIRPAQTLFNTDSTTVYLYVNKVKSNLFDGILGFGNDEKGDFRLNGDVKIELNNNFNGMEQIRLHWIATADKSTSLDLGVRVPYLFQSPIGTHTRLNVFKKDSTYVNTKIEERLFYQLGMNSNLGLNLSYESSNFVLDKNPAMASLYDDFSKTGYGLSYEMIVPTANRLLEGKTKIYLVGKALNRKITEFDEEENDYFDQKTKQYEVGVDAFHLFRMHPKHYLKTRIQAFGLFGSDEYFAQNELYRIGGFNSIRGFNEESITASTYGLASLEYRFLPNEGFYISWFGDYAFVENKSAELNQNLFGTGIGLSFLTQMGIFNLSYAVGKQSDTGFDFRNSKIHFGILSRF